MKTSDLLMSSLHISEDEYVFTGSFLLSSGHKTMPVDISDLQKSEKIRYLKFFFNLEETEDEIIETLMNMIIEKSSVTSRGVGC